MSCDIIFMMEKSVKIPLQLDVQKREVLLETLQQVRVAFVYSVKVCNELKSTSKITISQKCYSILREMLPCLPSTLVTATIAKACAEVRRHNGLVQKAGKKWTWVPKRDINCLFLTKLCFNLRGNLFTVSSVENRQRFIITVPRWFLEKYKIEQPSDITYAIVKYHPQEDKFVLNLTYKIECPQNKEGEIIGIDRGLYNLAALSDGTLYSSKQIVAQKRKYQYLRRTLWSLGTKSAKRKLKKLAGKEERFMTNVNNCIAKELAARTNVGTYVLEDLSIIRENCGKSKTNHKVNRWIHQWSFKQFEFSLQSHCTLAGIRVVFVDPHYTSQRCNNCGNVSPTARNKGKYVCPHCGHVDHADVNAAKNIRDIYAHSLKVGQVVSDQPND